MRTFGVDHPYLALGSTRRIRHECVPSRNTSPTIDSMAKSSLTVPTGVSSGSAITR